MIFGPKKKEDGSWRTMHNDELHSLYSSPNIVTIIKSMRIRWAGHVALTYLLTYLLTHLFHGARHSLKAGSYSAC
jgi:hypothetical protein